MFTLLADMLILLKVGDFGHGRKLRVDMEVMSYLLTLKRFPPPRAQIQESFPGLWNPPSSGS